MKKIIPVLLLILSTLANASIKKDIVIKAKFDRHSSGVMIERIRSILVERNVGDPYRQSLGDVSVEFSQVMDRLPPETQQWVRDLQEVLPLRIFDSEYRLIVRNFGYSVTGFNAELLPQRTSPERVDYVTMNYAEGLVLEAGSIAFEVKLPQAEDEEPIAFEVVLLNPSFTLSPEITAAIPMGWATSLMPNELFFSLHTIDLSQTFKKLKDRPDLMAFNMKDLILPEVSIRIGSREIVFDHAKIKKFLKNKEEELKKGLLDMIEARMHSQLANVLQDNPMEAHFARSFDLRGKMNAQFNLSQINVEEKSILSAQLNGKFLNQSGQEISVTVRRQLEDTFYDQSMDELNESLEFKSANVAMSVSENFLNQIVEAAIDSGTLNLANQTFRFGPEKLFVLAEKKGEALSLYLDIIHKLSGAQRVLVGRSELRFPVKLDIGVKVINTSGYPRLQIRVLGIDTSDEELVNGIPKYKLLSNVTSVRFRKKVLASIREEISTFENKLLLDLELKEFKGTYLERLSFYSDGLGRATALLNLEK